MRRPDGARRGPSAVTGLWQDAKLAVRQLRATPVVTAVAILSLALGIGANTAIFSIVNSLILRELPVKEPARLALVTDAAIATRARAWSYPIWDQIRRRPELFDTAAAWSFTRLNLSAGGETRTIDVLWASGSFFDALGVNAAVGRTFSIADERPGGGADGPVAVISDTFWRRQFGATRHVLGRSVRLEGTAFTIVGVAPPDFFGVDVGRSFDFVVPVAVAEPLVRGRDTVLDSPGTNFLTILARLRPGQSIDAAAAALRQVQPQVREATLGDVGRAGPGAAERYLRSPFTLLPAATGNSDLRLRYARPLVAIMVVVALVLLIACVNIANLSLARATARRHELSVRLALGASRWRLARQLLTESLVLSGAGAVAGLLLATWASRLLVRQLSTSVNTVFLDLAIDGRILAFTTAVAALTTLFVGTAPAFRAARVAPMEAMKEDGRGTAGQPRGPLAGWLVVVQVALSVVLVVAAGLFGRSFLSLTTRSLGFQPDRVLVVAMNAQRTTAAPAQRVPLYQRALDAVRARPDVAGAALSHTTPLGSQFEPLVAVSGRPPDEPPVRSFGNLISAGWFDTYGTPIVAGRDLTERDRKGEPRVAIVNQAFARRFIDGNPIGRTITVFPHTPMATAPLEIVGVAGNAIYASPREPAPPTWYAPIDQFDVPDFTFVSARLSVRPRSGAPASLTRGVATAIGRVDPQLTLTFRPLADVVAGALAQDRLTALVAGFFGGLALLLAGLGLYGVTAYAVSRRRAEIGIRMALGAAPGAVVTLILGRVCALVGIGVAIGAGISAWASTLVASLLYGLEPRDPFTLAVAIAALAGVGLAAGWIPASRAARIDPAQVLREG